jgi:ornithine cyclodeaminase
LDDFGPDAILEAEKIVVDEFEGCVREEKTFHRLVLDGLIDRNRIYAELGEVVVGKKPGRTGDERVFGNLMGMAVEDISVAKKVYDAITTKE